MGDDEQAGTAVRTGHGLGYPHDRWEPCLLHVYPGHSSDHHQPDKPALCRGPACGRSGAELPRSNVGSPPVLRVATRNGRGDVEDRSHDRVPDYLAGYVDGEGSFHVALQRNPSSRHGWQLVPEFHVSQNPERASVLLLIQSYLGCGRIRPNARKGALDRSLVFVVRNRTDLVERVIPFFEAHPLLSEKRGEFETFAVIVRAMAAGEHLVPEGFRLRELALRMNGAGRYRRLHRPEDGGPPSVSSTAPREDDALAG